MTDRFKWGTCCTLFLILQYFLSPLTPSAIAEAQVDDATAPPLAGELAPSIPSPPPTSAEASIGLPEEATEEPSQKDDSLPRKNWNLAGLVGASEVSVYADADGRFVNSLTESRLFEEKPVHQTAETTLQNSILTGRQFNRETLAALARTKQAKAQTGQALALLLPSVSVNASRGYEISKPSVNVDPETDQLAKSDRHIRTDATLTVRQPLFNLPTFLDWRRRKVLEQARGENYRVADGDAYIATVNSYLSLVASRLQMDMIRAFEKQLADLLDYIEKRAEAGAASVSDMARVHARSQATLSLRLEQESAHAASGVEFIRLTNLAPQIVSLPEVADVGGAMLPELFDQAVKTAMKSNPEIAALAAEVDAANIDRKAAKGQFFPRIDAEYTSSYSKHPGGNKNPAVQKDERIMMVINWDLFSGGRDYKYNVERSERYKELQYRLDDQRRRVVQALSANYATLQTTRDRIASGYEELNSISTAADAMSKRMISGNQSLLDLLDVYDRLYQVRSRLVNLHVLEMNTVAQLIRLTIGTPWEASDLDNPEAEKMGILSRSSALPARKGS